MMLKSIGGFDATNPARSKNMSINAVVRFGQIFFCPGEASRTAPVNIACSYRRIPDRLITRARAVSEMTNDAALGRQSCQYSFAPRNGTRIYSVDVSSIVKQASRKVGPLAFGCTAKNALPVRPPADEVPRIILPTKA
jgi:hypothetical protein